MDATRDRAADQAGTGRVRPWLNWILAVLTVPAAAAVMLFALAATMSTTGCAYQQCRHQGPGEFWFGVLFYGAPVVAVATLALSLFTARRPRGWVVPVCGLVLLAIDLAVFALSFQR
ncbi:hypothetical protein [Mycobacterium sp.]|jgi:hypothetical protein|uniref:hypothetical protein n=1 Tax=Mycobacterium sp. TaxID=1785 RepID=UPI002D62AE58|nr:hypothetical protein [Mycobacterium sp.]HZA10214.1 hypothetical protein [Mycobacterium sp.]